jgi:hypothetical protein
VDHDDPRVDLVVVDVAAPLGLAASCVLPGRGRVDGASSLALSS